MSAFGGKADDPAAFARYSQKSANGRIAAVFCRASVQRRDAGLLNDAGPQLDFAFEKCPNLLRRIRTALVAERHQTPLHVRIGERGNRVGIHFLDDFAWSLGRHEKPVPGNHVKAGDTVLGDRWNFGGDGGALGAGAAPRYGTCTISMPAMCLNSSPQRCGDDPVPGEASVSLPGFVLA